MRIGIDIDGVLIDREVFILTYGVKYCMEHNLTYRINQQYYKDEKFIGLSPENIEKFWNENLRYYVTDYPAREAASTITNKLRDEGYEIYILTSRNEWELDEENHGQMRRFTKEWLDKNNISYDKIVYTEESKLAYCVGNYIDVMIEDHPQNIKEISKKLPVFCYNCNYNAEVKGKNITRVYSWYDVYNKIKNGKIM